MPGKERSRVPRTRKRRQGGTRSLALPAARGAPREQRMKGWKSHSPTPKQHRQLRRGGWERRRSRRRRRPGRGGISAGLARGAGQGPRGTRWGDPAQLPRPLPAPSSLAPPAPGGQAAGRAGGAGAAQPAPPPAPSRLSPNAAGPAPPGPPSAGAHSASRRPGGRTPSPGTGSPAPSPTPVAAARPPLTQAHGTSCPAPAPHAGKWRRRGSLGSGEEAGQRWRRSAATPCFPPSALGVGTVRGWGAGEGPAGRDGELAPPAPPSDPRQLQPVVLGEAGPASEAAGFWKLSAFPLGLGTPAQSP